MRINHFLIDKIYASIAQRLEIVYHSEIAKTYGDIMFKSYHDINVAIRSLLTSDKRTEQPCFLDRFGREKILKCMNQSRSHHLKSSLCKYTDILFYNKIVGLFIVILESFQILVPKQEGTHVRAERPYKVIGISTEELYIIKNAASNDYGTGGVDIQ